jgi:hypothetical protein
LPVANPPFRVPAHRPRGRVGAALALAAALLTACSGAQPQGTGTVQGTVYEFIEEGGELLVRPLAGVSVSMEGLGRTAGRTRRDGRYLLQGLPEEGDRVLRADAPGYVPALSPPLAPGATRQDIFMARFELIQRLAPTRRDDTNVSLVDPVDLIRGALIARVVDAETHVPLGGVRVGVLGKHVLGMVLGRGPWGPEEPSVGGVMVDGLEGHATVRFSAPGYDIPDQQVQFISGAVIGLNVLGHRLPSAEPGPAPGGVTFRDATAASGLQLPNGFGYLSPFSPFTGIPMLGQGVVARDFDGDGHTDLLFTNTSPERHRLMLNDGTGRFMDATAGSGLDMPINSSGACAGDLDNDGLPDLYIAGETGEGMLYMNAGAGKFRAHAWPLGSMHEGYSCAFADIDGDGRLDLVFGGNEFVDGRKKNKVVVALNDGQSPVETLRLEPRGARTLVLAFIDVDSDGVPELLTGSDFGALDLFRFSKGADGSLQASSISAESGLTDTTYLKGGWMGWAVGDFDGNGAEDIFATNIASLLLPFLGSNPALGRNYLGAWDPTLQRFARRDLEAGVADTGWAWGTEAADFDNDGCLDLIVARSFFWTFGFSSAAWRRGLPPLAWKQEGISSNAVSLFHNACDQGPTFREVTAQARIDVPHDARGLAMGDFNADGFPDFVVSSVLDPVILLMNEGNQNAWLGVRVQGTTSNRDGIGARVKVTAGGRSQVRYVRSGSSYLSGSVLHVHFGVGAATEVDQVEVRFPSGKVVTTGSVATRQLLEVVEPLD